MSNCRAHRSFPSSWRSCALSCPARWPATARLWKLWRSWPRPPAGGRRGPRPKSPRGPRRSGARAWPRARAPSRPARLPARQAAAPRGAPRRSGRASGRRSVAAGAAKLGALSVHSGQALWRAGASRFAGRAHVGVRRIHAGAAGGRRRTSSRAMSSIGAKTGIWSKRSGRRYWGSVWKSSASWSARWPPGRPRPRRRGLPPRAAIWGPRSGAWIAPTDVQIGRSMRP